ncbi:MAG: MarR family transcriptional regulator [Marinobacter sp.]|uniref:MarR family winged helix-turn-helix transcriptional regulator n=1 Tax=Marinobacter sp. TaxID=50741 RepID=UPI00299EEEE5|nr:MarR family transcriptional regulator [Marinobacter sp.]MDX1633009.1 MarR family transcriptional regulator [Marinobacter sp.]
MTDSNHLALDNQICFALYAANRAVTARYRPLLSALGLTYPQYLVMLVLWETTQGDERVRVSDLGKRLRLDSGTLTPLLKRLEEQGLVRRRREAADQRVVLLDLTEQGRSLRARAETLPARLLCDSGVAPDRAAALRDELRALLNELEGGASSSAR